jgi:hypothetical protein
LIKITKLSFTSTPCNPKPIQLIKVLTTIHQFEHVETEMENLRHTGKTSEEKNISPPKMASDICI